MRLVGQTAELNFRQVYKAEASTGSTPQDSGTVTEPSATPPARPPTGVRCHNCRHRSPARVPPQRLTPPLHCRS